MLTVRYPIPFLLPPNVTCSPARSSEHTFTSLTTTSVYADHFVVWVSLASGHRGGSFTWMARGIRDGMNGEHDPLITPTPGKVSSG
jgi:hypothetical protein